MKNIPEKCDNIRLNPLQEVGVMKFKVSLVKIKVKSLNPLQEVGVMKFWTLIPVQ